MHICIAFIILLVYAEEDRRGLLHIEMLKNITETLVTQKLDSIWKNKDYVGCRCEKCRGDIIAYALNHLNPRYVSTAEGEIYARTQALSTEYDFEVLRVLATAIKEVGEHPHHEGYKT